MKVLLLLTILLHVALIPTTTTTAVDVIDLLGSDSEDDNTATAAVANAAAHAAAPAAQGRIRRRDDGIGGAGRSTRFRHDVVDLCDDDSDGGGESDDNSVEYVPPQPQAGNNPQLHHAQAPPQVGNNVQQAAPPQVGNNDWNLYHQWQNLPQWARNLLVDPYQRVQQFDNLRSIFSTEPNFMQLLGMLQPNSPHRQLMRDDTNTPSMLRMLFSPDGFLHSLIHGRVLAILNFVPNTRIAAGQTPGSLGQRHVINEQSIDFIIETFVRILVRYGLGRQVALVLALCTIVFADRMPFSGPFWWHSRLRSLYNRVARITDPLQQGVLRHLLERLINIDVIWNFGRPSWNALGADLQWLQAHFPGRDFHQFQTTLLYHPCCVAMGWMNRQAQRDWVQCLSRTAAYLLGMTEIDFTDDELNDLLPRRRSLPEIPPDGDIAFVRDANGRSVSLSPGMVDILREYDLMDRYGELPNRRGSTLSMNVAEQNGTAYTVAEYGCTNRNCDHTNIVRLGARCACNRGTLRVLTTESGLEFDALEYAYAANCDHCVGLLGTPCTCNCGVEPRYAGYFNRGIDPNNYTARNDPKCLLAYATDSHGVIQNPGSFKTAGKLVTDMLPTLIQISETGVDGQDFIKTNYPWAVNFQDTNRTNEFTFRSNEKMARKLSAEMFRNPNRAIVVGEKHYKMRPWNYNRGER